MKENVFIDTNIISHSSVSLGWNDVISKPILELGSNGDIFIKGKLIENDKEVVDGMREFLGSWKKIMSKKNWLWMGHAGHFCASSHCRFKLNTYVNGYIISTVGEYVPDSQIREIYSKTRNIKIEGSGDFAEADWLRKNGFEDLGYKRTYETMVFKSIKNENLKYQCCPYEADVSRELELEGYNDAASATQGHYAMCNKYDALKGSASESELIKNQTDSLPECEEKPWEKDCLVVCGKCNKLLDEDEHFAIKNFQFPVCEDCFNKLKSESEL